MFDMCGDNLRVHLRNGCVDLHARLDAAVSRADLSEPAGYVRFLGMNACALGALASSGACGKRIGNATLASLATAAARDLKALGTKAPHSGFRRNLSPLAIDYVVLGSRIGTRVLRRRWLESRDKRVRQADAYFSEPESAHEWKDLCTELSGIAVSDTDSPCILEDARTLFGLFLDSFAMTTGIAEDA